MPEAGKFDGGSVKFTKFNKVLQRLSYYAGGVTIGQFEPGAKELTIDTNDLIAKMKAGNGGKLPEIQVQ